MPLTSSFMLFYLPLLHATLQPCSENWAAMPATAGSRFCARCQHTVHDFTELADPAAALAAARAASPTGRVCGRFAAAQVARPRLSGRLRRFVVALVLVFGLGLPAHEALAQVRQAQPTARALSPERVFGMVERMPEYKAGGRQGLMHFMQKTCVYPAKASGAGKVYLGFTVNEAGKVRNLHIVRGLEPLLDAEALRAARLMGDWKPGTQSGRPVAMNFTMPVTFTKPVPTRQRRPSRTSAATHAVGCVEAPLLMHIDGGFVSAQHDTIWVYEEMPAFSGGDYRAMATYVQQQLRWPKGSERVCASGKVFVSFTVGVDSLLHDIKVVKGLEASLDAAAVRAVQTLDGLQPGRKKGRPVAVTLTIPVSFNRE